MKMECKGCKKDKELKYCEQCFRDMFSKNIEQMWELDALNKVKKIIDEVLNKLGDGKKTIREDWPEI